MKTSRQILILLVLIIILSLTGCTSNEQKAYNLALKELKATQTLLSVNKMRVEDVELVDNTLADDYYRVQLYYETQTKGGITQSVSTWCKVVLPLGEGDVWCARN